jgi:hypothetical protein
VIVFAAAKRGINDSSTITGTRPFI